MSRFSIVIPVRDGASTIEGCLRSALSQDGIGDYEVILVDNGSLDRTCEIAQQLDVKIIHERKRGRSAARNAGIREAKGEVIGLLDADCRAPRDWMRTSIDLLSDSWIGATQVRVRKDGQPAPGPEFSQIHYWLPFLDTCAMVTTREAFRAARGFDEDLPRAVDMDYSFRLLACGYALGWIPEVTVIKHHALNHKQLARRGWDGGVSLSRLDRKWRHKLPAESVQHWIDPVKAWVRTTVKDGLHPVVSRGFNATEASLKLAGWLRSELFESTPPTAKYEPVTALSSVIGSRCSLVVSPDGALLLDTDARRATRLDRPRLLAIRRIMAGETNPERIAEALAADSGLGLSAALTIARETIARSAAVSACS